MMMLILTSCARISGRRFVALRIHFWKSMSTSTWWPWTYSWNVFSAGKPTAKQTGQLQEGKTKNLICIIWAIYWHIISTPSSSSHDYYVIATRDGSNILMQRMFNYFYHYDLIFKLSPMGHRLRKVNKILHQHTGISWVWIVQVYTLSQLYSVSLEEQVSVWKGKEFLFLMELL